MDDKEYYLVATQGSQGVVALREMFAGNIHPENIHVAICENGSSQPLIEFIKYNTIDYSSHDSGSNFTSWLMNNEQRFDHLLSISWKYLFDNNVISYFDEKSVNFHPGLLPAYRGCFSTPWSIINEEKYVGYTYHYISENFDEGDVLFQEKIKISDEDTAHSLNYKIFQKGLSNLIKVISLIGSNGKPQLGPAHYYKNKPPFDGKRNPNWTIKEKNNFIKAMYFPPYENSLDLLDDYGNDRI